MNNHVKEVQKASNEMVKLESEQEAGANIPQERFDSAFKDLYELIKYCMKNEFKQLPSYQQFCEGLESNFMYLAIIGQLLGQINKSLSEN